MFEERRPGKKREKSGLRAGSEAQATATLISMPDQIAVLTPSRGGSAEFEISYRDLRRMIDVTQTLEMDVRRVGDNTEQHLQGAEPEHNH